MNARRRIGRSIAACLAAGFVLLAAGSAVAAWTTAASINPSNGVTAATIAAPASVNAAPAPGCTSVTITWTAVSGANAYRVERTLDGGTTWVDRAASTTGTSWTDTGGVPSGQTGMWRVRGKLTTGTWEGSAVSTTAVSCVTGYNLQATNPSNRVDLTWNASSGATGYDIQRRVGGGAWIYLHTDRAGTTFADTEAQSVGETLDYRVKSVSSTGVRDTVWSNVATITSWQGTLPPGNTGGLSVTRTMSNDWGNGYQASVAVKNNGATTVTWQISLSLATFPFNGTLSSVSNAQTVSTVGTTWTVKGQSYNATVAPGATVTFSYQGNRGSTPAPIGQANAAITVTNEWGAGYCANVVVSTMSPVPITWEVTLTRASSAPFAATPTLWPVSPSLSNGTQQSLTATQWVFRGVSHNATVVDGAPVTLSYCATKSP